MVAAREYREQQAGFRADLGGVEGLGLASIHPQETLPTVASRCDRADPAANTCMPKGKQRSGGSVGHRLPYQQ